MWELDCEESWALKNWCFWTVVLEKTLESPLDCKEIQPVPSKGDQSWAFTGRTDAKAETLATSWEELTHWKRPWCWEGLGAGGEGDDRGWDGWMTSPTRWTRVWVISGGWWWTGRPGMLQFMRSQRVGQDWATELRLFTKIKCNDCSTWKALQFTPVFHVDSFIHSSWDFSTPLIFILSQANCIPLWSHSIKPSKYFGRNR